MTPRAMGRARSFWLIGFSHMLGSEQVSVDALRTTREGILIPRVVVGCSGSRSGGIPPFREGISGRGVSMMQYDQASSGF